MVQNVLGKESMNILYKIRNWLLEDKMRLAGLVWILFSILMGMLSALNTITLTNDDTYMYQRFNDFEASKGFWKTVYTLFFNLDLVSTGEMRTYGLSKVIQFLLHHIVGQKAWLYQFFITSTHTLSGIIIYKILKRLGFTLLPSALAVVAFTLNPFSHVQTFHHWTYLMLPLYFVLIYIWTELVNIQKRIVEGKQITWKRHLFSFAIIFVTVFTGEYTLPMLGVAICIFGIYGIIKKSKELIFTYASHIIIQGILVISWVVLWKNVLTQNQVGRFTIQKPNFGIFNMITLAVTGNFKRYLFLGNSNKLNMGQDGIFSMIIAFLLVIFVGVTAFMVYSIIKSKIAENGRASWKINVLIICFSLSSFILYTVMNVLCYTGMSYHYFYSIYSLFTVVFTIVLCSIFKRKKVQLIILTCLLIIFTGYNIVWYAYLKPTAAQIDKEIISQVENAAKNGKKTLVVLMKDTVYGEVLLDSKCYRPLSLFSSGWTSQPYLNSIFSDVIYIDYNSQIIDNGSDTFTIKGKNIIHKNNYALGDLQFSKKDVLFICNDNKTSTRKYYSSIDDYLYRKNLEICSANNNYDKNYSLAFIPPMLYIDVGNDYTTQGLMKDKVYSEDSKDLINYGYLDGDSLTYSVDLDTSNIGKMFKTNRYSNTSFSYKFTQLPEEKELAIIIDIMEFWQKKTEGRLFDIIVEADSSTTTYRDIDPYKLSLNKETGEVSPLRLGINLPKTKQATITFVSKKGYDVATIHGIGIIER